MTLLATVAGALRTRYQRKQDDEIALAADRASMGGHRCDSRCIPAPYLGPVRLGRRDEPVTPGRAA